MGETAPSIINVEDFKAGNAPALRSVAGITFPLSQRWSATAGSSVTLAFRTMTPADIDAAVEFDRKCFSATDAWNRDDFLDVVDDAETEFIVGELDGKIVACAGAEIFNDTAEILTFAVAPDCRRQKIGTLIFDKLIGAILRRGVNFIGLEVRLSNEAAINFYEGFGFQIVERREKFYLDEDAWIMAREF